MSTEENKRFDSIIAGNFFVLLVFISFIVRAILIYVVPPLLDVFYYDTQAVFAFLQAVNPYGHTYTGIPDWLSTPGAQNVYTYLPGVFLFLSPFAFLGDVRYGLIVADMIIGWSIFVMMGKNSRKASLLYLLAPFSILFSTVYPNNTLVAMLFLGLVIVFEKIGKEVFSAVLFGFSLASSQFSLLVYPFFLILKLKNRNFRWVFVSLASFLLIIIPFLLWDPGSFLHDTIAFQFTRSIRPLVLSAKIGYNLNPSLSGIVYTFFGFPVPVIVRALIVLLIFLLFVRRTFDMRSLLLNCSCFLTLTMFILPNDFSWWFLELPFQTFLLSFSLDV